MSPSDLSTRKLVEDNIEVLYDYFSFVKRDVFRAKQYGKVLEALRGLPDGANANTLENVASGPKIRGKISQMVKTGKDLDSVIRIREETKSLPAVKELMELHGIGPVRAMELVRDHGVKGISDLVVRAESLSLTEATKRGLRMHEDFSRRIPRKEMLKHANLISKTLGDRFKYVIAGSFRRNAATSSDIDILLTGNVNDLNDMTSALEKVGYIDPCNALAHGVLKYMGACKLPRHKYFRRLDIMYTPPNEYAFALLHFTGSGSFNARMRAHALSRGYSLSEKGIVVLDKWRDLVPSPGVFETEEDIFKFLEYEYVDPVDR